MNVRVLRITILLACVLCVVPCLHAQDRMPPIPPDKMTPAQKKAAADYKAIRGSDPSGPPWAVIARVPELLVPALQIRMALHQQQPLERFPRLGQGLSTAGK